MNYRPRPRSHDEAHAELLARLDADAPRRARLPTVADAGGSVVALRRVSGGVPTELSRDDREQLLADALAGKLVSLDVEAVTFIQRDTPNRNLVRFKAGVLQKLAPSFAGMPVLRDHEQHDTTARGGTIIESKLEDHPTEAGAKQIRQVLRLTAPWAVEMALRGLMDQFSIGWHSSGGTVCSVCGEPMTALWFWLIADCDHELGAEYDGQVCQLEYTDAVGIEVSAVSVPAVLGTHVEDIRAQLAAARLSAGPAAKGQRKEPAMKSFALIAAICGLAADAPEADVVAGVERLKTERDGARAALKDAQGELSAAQANLAEVEKTARETRRDGLLLRALKEGRYAKGSRSEAHAQKLAERGDLDGLEAFIEDLEPGAAVPVGELRSAGGDPTPKSRDVLELTAEDKEAAARMGVTPEKYLELKRDALASLGKKPAAE